MKITNSTQTIKEPKNLLRKVSKELQARSPTVMGLTARAYYGKEDTTLKTIESLGMPITNPFPQKEVQNNIVNDDPKSGFWNGIIFTHYRPKGEFLAPFLESLRSTIGYVPEKVMFVDDVESNCLSVKACLESLKIPGIIWHYSRVAR